MMRTTRAWLMLALAPPAAVADAHNVICSRFDNGDEMVPALTANRIPKYEMGSQAAGLLLDLINGIDRNPVVIRMQPNPVIRNSTGPALASQPARQ